MLFGLHLRRKKKKDERRWARKMRHNSAEAFPAKYTYLREIQEGAEGVVQAWAHKTSGAVVAVKVVKSKADLPREVQILTSLPEHPSILKCLAYCDKQPTPEKLSIVLEFCPGGDMYEFYWDQAFPRNKAAFSEAFMWSVYSQLSSALAFLHQGVGITNQRHVDNWRPIVHRDIKLENILIVTTGTKHDWSTIVLKLADFGLSAFYDPAAARLPPGMGTTYCWAPEVTWKNNRITPAGDVWSLGAVIHVLAHSFGPIVNPEEIKLKWFRENAGMPYPSGWPELIKQGYWGATAPRKVVPINLNTGTHEEDYRRQRPSPKYSDGLNACMMMALQMDPKERADAGELLEHIEEEYANFLFRELTMETIKETVKETETTLGYSDEDY